jgi:hypothetical protein
MRVDKPSLSVNAVFGTLNDERDPATVIQLVDNELGRARVV